jgi:hypothetical protein
MNDDLRQLRKKIDGSDLFMNSFQIKKISRRKREPFSWALDDKESRNILLSSFPKLKTDCKQRQSAARWARIIHLFYRMNLTEREVAEELGCTYNTVNMILYRIRKRAAGKYQGYRGYMGGKKRE